MHRHKKALNKNFFIQEKMIMVQNALTNIELTSILSLSEWPEPGMVFWAVCLVRVAMNENTTDDWKREREQTERQKKMKLRRTETKAK